MTERTEPHPVLIAGRFGVVESESGLLWHVAEIVSPAKGWWITLPEAYAQREIAVRVATMYARTDTK